jgi:hypothetical protein
MKEVQKQLLSILEQIDTLTQREENMGRHFEIPNDSGGVTVYQPRFDRWPSTR